MLICLKLLFILPFLIEFEKKFYIFELYLKIFIISTNLVVIIVLTKQIREIK